jgi:Putative peptidoglycan binding domain
VAKKSKKVTKNRINLSNHKTRLLLFTSLFSLIGVYFLITSFAATAQNFVRIVSTPSGKGYWILKDDGDFYSFGDAIAITNKEGGGDLKNKTIDSPVADMAVMPDSAGYFMVTKNGTVHNFAGAPKLSVAVDAADKGKIVAIVNTTTGKGFWLISSTSKIYAAGDAVGRFDITKMVKYGIDTNPAIKAGSLSNIVAADRTNENKGMWLMAKDGTVYGVGVTGGRQPGIHYSATGAEIVADNVDSILIVSSKGEVVDHGSAVQNSGDLIQSPNLKKSTAPIVGIAKNVAAGGKENTSYWLLSADGRVYAFGTQAKHYGEFVPKDPATTPPPTDGGGDDGGDDGGDNGGDDSGSTPPPPPTTYNGNTVEECKKHTLKFGDSGTCLNVFQNKLKSKGYTIDVNGKFDEKTKLSLTAFQQTNNLVVSQKIDSPTWDKVATLDDRAQYKVPCIGDGQDGARVQTVYAYEEGEANRLDRLTGDFKRKAKLMNDEVEASAKQQNGIRRMRFAHDSNCEITIATVQLKKRASVEGIGLVNLLNELISKDFNDNNKKYLIYYDTKIDFCGFGMYWPKNPFSNTYESDPYTGDHPDPKVNPNEVYTSWAFFEPGCWSAQKAVGDENYGDVQLHELFHVFGAVSPNSPNHSAAGHCTDDQDLMCYNDQSQVPGSQVNFRTNVCTGAANNYLLDCNKDDYFSLNPASGSYLSNHWNSANTRWLERQ